MLDELLVGGEMQETSKRNIIRAVTAQDMLQEVRDPSSENIEQYAELLAYVKEIQPEDWNILYRVLVAQSRAHKNGRLE